MKSWRKTLKTVHKTEEVLELVGNKVESAELVVALVPPSLPIYLLLCEGRYNRHLLLLERAVWPVSTIFK